MGGEAAPIPQPVVFSCRAIPLHQSLRAAAWFDCRVRQVVVMGDHACFVDEVVGRGRDAKAPPLVYDRGRLHGLGQPVAPTPWSTLDRGDLIAGWQPCQPGSMGSPWRGRHLAFCPFGSWFACCLRRCVTPPRRRLSSGLPIRAIIATRAMKRM